MFREKIDDILPKWQEFLEHEQGKDGDEQGINKQMMKLFKKRHNR